MLCLFLVSQTYYYVLLKVVTDELINTLTLAPGHVMDVHCMAMENDGIFWVKLAQPVEKTTPLYQLTFKCR